MRAAANSSDGTNNNNFQSYIYVYSKSLRLDFIKIYTKKINTFANSTKHLLPALYV